MQTQQTITFFGTVRNSATSRISKNGRKYTAFGVAIISDRNLQAFHYNVVAFGKKYRSSCLGFTGIIMNEAGVAQW